MGGESIPVIFMTYFMVFVFLSVGVKYTPEFPFLPSQLGIQVEQGWQAGGQLSLPRWNSGQGLPSFTHLDSSRML